MSHTPSPPSSVLGRVLTSALNFDSHWWQPLQITLVVAFLSLIVWAHTFDLIEADHIRVMETAENDISNLGRVGLEHAERTLTSVDLTLKMARAEYLHHGSQFDFKAFTNQGLFDARVVRRISMIDAQGHLKLSTQASSPQANLSGMGYFKAHQASESDALYISDTDLGRDAQEPTLQLSRRITLKNGQFGGVMVAAMDLRYFSRFYADLNLGLDGVASMVKPEGTVLVRRFGQVDQFSGRLPSSEVIDRLALGDPLGTLQVHLKNPESDRLFHFRKLPSFALVLTFSMDLNAVLAGHQKTRRILLREATGLSLILSIFGFMLAWYSLVRRKVVQTHQRQLLALQALNHRAPGMIYQFQQLANGTSKFLFVSEGARELFRLSPETLMADATQAFSLLHPDDAIRMTKSTELSARSLSPWQLEFRLCFDDGAVRWVAANSSPQPGENGSIVWDGFMSDITEHKRIEAAANDANLAKTHFLSSMSHEIRSPLNAILGLAYLLEQAQLPQDASNMVRQIRASGRILLGLISDILDVSKIEAGQMLIEKAPFRLSDVLDNVASILKVAVGQKDIQLIILPPPPGVYTLMGDVLRLEQVLLNLSNNAIKFTAVGQVEVSCELFESHSDRVILRFCVRDSGIGIAPELQSGVFAAFTQADSSTTRRFGGTGLGLTICRQLVELMGGEIGMSSVPELGSQFWFTLPLEKVADSEISATESRKLDALIVDDSEIALAYVSMVATELGWHALPFDSSEGVLTHLLTHQDLKMPDVVVIDWKMPGLDGLATVRLIREQLPPEKCPLLIMMTNHSLASLVQAEGVERVDALLEKPVTASSLHHAVLEATRKRGSADRLSLATPIFEGLVLLGIRVLVVDDSEINCEVARRILAGQGAQVSLATNGQEALDWLQANPEAVDLVLMDVQMPIMDGMEATRLLRLQSAFADLPIVALTAGASRAQQLAAQAAGMTHFVSKPFDVPSTLALIVQLVRKAAREVPNELSIEPSLFSAPDFGMAVLNAPEGLKIWGDMASYKSFLNKFIGLYLNAAAQMNASLSNGDRAAAIALAHKLAGVAANLALPETHRLASEAESVLTNLSDPGQTLSALENALVQAAAAIEQLAASSK